MSVFVEQPLLLGLDEVLDLEGLSNNRSPDAQKFGGAIVVTPFFVYQLSTEHAERLPIDHDGNTDEAQFTAAGALLFAAESVQKQRLPAGLWHHNWLAAFNHAADDTLTNTIGDAPSGVAIQAVSCLRAKLAGFTVKQH